MKQRRAQVQIVLLVLMAAFAATLPADGFIIIPRPPRPPHPGPVSPFPLQVVRHDVQVDIDGQLATTVVDQEFFNPHHQRLEGEYLFPLPAGAVIKDFSMWIDGRETRAELLDAARARGIYEDIVRRLRDPALLEYDGRGVFRMRVFPIEPRRRKRIRIAYHEVLEKSNGAVAYLYPLGTEKFSSRAIPEVSVVVNIHSPEPLAAVHCPSHAVQVTRPAPGRATVRYSGRDILPDSDFRLFFTPAAGRFGCSLLAYRPNGRDGTFFLNISPSFAGNGTEVAAKDITFVVDTSGSMAGKAMEQARKAMAYCLGRLNRSDRFNVIRFATEAESLFARQVPATETNRRLAQEFVADWQAAGGTHCEDALKAALAESGSGDRSRLVVFITDGRPTIGETGEEALLRIVDKARQGNHSLRLFPVAIGSEINTHLLDRMAELTRTFRTYIGIHEDIESGISGFYDRIGSPVLADVRLDISGNARAFQVHPRPLPDIFQGTALTVVGRYRGSGPATITLSGKVNGRFQEFAFNAVFPNESLDHDFLPPLWAARRVGFLLDQLRLHGEEKELIDEITRLARQYGIVTPYTSYLIVEDEKIRRGRGDLEDSDMTIGGLPAAPGLERQRREEFAAMKDKSGMGSVRASVELQKLNQATRVGASDSAQENSRVRIVRGAAFYLNKDTWVDGRIQARGSLPVKRIAFASAGYFALLDRHPELAPVLALGRSVRFVLGEAVVDVYDPGAETG